MLLVVDIGNTHIVMGVFNKEELSRNWRVSTISTRTSDEWFAQVMAFANSADFRKGDISDVAVSSVVPEVTFSFKKMAIERMGIEPFIVESGVDYGLKIAYDNPQAVGPDRICNSVAGLAKYGGPLIIVDFGTATTFDVVSEEGVYLGGAIAPGLETSSGELHRRAAKLTRVELAFPQSVIGKSTESSVQSGIMFGALEMVDGIVRRIWEEIGGKCRAISTGGLAALITPRSNTIELYEPFLVLRGLNIIFNRVRN